MINSNFEWKMMDSPLSQQRINELAQELNYSPLIIKILSQRGLTTKNEIKDFLNPQGQHVHDPYLLHDMEKAVGRIQKAIVENEHIYIYGDYDADGITSTAVMYETLLQLGANVDYFIPDRFKDGYGPNLREYQKLEQQGMQLLITVDNGVSGVDEVQYLMDQGIDVIITDHHALSSKIPSAYAVVHPDHPDQRYPFHGLAGVGVAFKVACALLDDIPQEELDLVAIGTIADVMPLIDENRDLVSFGIQALQSTLRPGLNALYQVTKTQVNDIDSDTVGFMISPRLNSLGRLENASLGVKLLTTFDEKEAMDLASHTHELNQQRQELVASITQDAERLLQQQSQKHLMNVIAGKGWHEGVLGIVASRITEETRRPTIVLTLTEDNIYKGSGRSVEGVDLFKAFNKHRELFESFGGHSSACGLSLNPEKIEEFQLMADQEAINQHFDGSQLPVIEISDELSVDQITNDLINELNLLAPFGTENSRPVFKIKDIPSPSIKLMGDHNQHYRIDFYGKNGPLAAVKFNPLPRELCELQSSSLDKLQIVGELTINRWRGKVSPQIQICDLKSDSLSDQLAFQIIDHRTIPLSKADYNPEYTYGFFNLSLLKKAVNHFPKAAKVMNLNGSEKINADTLVIVDCPPSIISFESLVKHINVQRLILKCYAYPNISEKRMPERKDFGKLYRFTSTHHDVDVRNDLKKLANYLNFDQELLVFMINVFYEAKFVKIKNGLLTGTPSSQRVDLTNTHCYQSRIAMIESQKLFLNSQISDILRKINLK